MAKENGPLLRVRNLKTYFPIRGGLFGRVRGLVKAVDDVSFDIGAGETLGLVGESGCGKTTLGLTVLCLIPPTAGEAFLTGRPLFRLDPRDLRLSRRRMQVIFQDPYGSLDPRMSVGQIVGEGLRVHGIATRKERRTRVVGLLERVGLSPGQASRYPHEFSGGQRQRIGIARALALDPDLIICDEPVSALDVSVQAQIINLLQDLQRELGVSYLFIAHDLSVVRQISHKVAVMYLGQIVELATTEKLYENPLHPYTQVLLAAVPLPVPKARKEVPPLGEPPSPASPPPGCRFHPRCPEAKEYCRRERPALVEISPDHHVACFERTPPGQQPSRGNSRTPEGDRPERKGDAR